jgi:deoxycytidylate deaminase
MTDRELMELIMGNKTLKSSRTVDQAAMSVAYLWAEARSKDPSTKVGACIVDAKSGGLFLGYNGFPPGIPDDASVWNLRTDMSEDRVRPVEGFELTKVRLGGARRGERGPEGSASECGLADGISHHDHVPVSSLHEGCRGVERLDDGHLWR